MFGKADEDKISRVIACVYEEAVEVAGDEEEGEERGKGGGKKNELVTVWHKRNGTS